MNTLGQALEMAKRLRSLMGSWPLPQEAAGTIDALIAANLDLVYQFDSLREDYKALKSQKPVAAIEISVSESCTTIDNKYFDAVHKWPAGKYELYRAAGAQPYDQQAMEPCEACGWKAIIPGEPCLVCERNAMLAAGAQPVQQEKMCPYCGGSGDITSLDGEWRGKCVCEAGTPAAAAQAVPQQFGNESHFRTRQERAKPVQREPLFWYRPCSDGGYEGPISNGSIEDVRKRSGAWIPLVAAPVQAGAQAQAQEQRKPLTMIEMVDAAMVAMADFYPPITRSQCQRIINAAAHGIKEQQ